MTPQQKLQDDILGILYKNKSDESDEGSWIESKDFHAVAEAIANIPIPTEAVAVIRKLANGRFGYSVDNHMKMTDGLIEGATIYHIWQQAQEQQERMARAAIYPKWKLVPHHEQGQEDSNFYWEITDGTNGLLSHMDEKEDLQQVIDVLNRINAELYIDKGAEAAASHVASHFQHELQLLCEKVYAYAHMNKSAGYNGEDDKGREREPERGSIYEIAKAYLPYRHPHEKGLRKKLFPCAFSQCENETELHIDIWGKRQYVCEYHLSSIINQLESDDTDL